MREQVEDAGGVIDSWIEAFEMVQDENGKWSYAEWTDNCVEYRERYFELLKQWNRHVDLFNNTTQRRNVGRPLAASAAQVTEVRKLHKAGGLRCAALPRTAGSACNDGANHHRASTTAPTAPPSSTCSASTLTGSEVLTWKARKRTRDGLPKRIDATYAGGTRAGEGGQGARAADCDRMGAAVRTVTEHHH